jgi:hypothetical protein
LLDDLTGGPATDQDIVAAVLTKAGVSFSGGNIGGTGQLLGTVADDAFMWRVGQSALDYIDAVDKSARSPIRAGSIARLRRSAA